VKASKSPPQNHERWLVSYADFMTLLLAFFVVMYASAQKDRGMAKQVAESIRDAMQHGQLSQALDGILNNRKTAPDGKGDTRTHTAAPPLPPPPQAPATRADLAKSSEVLKQALKLELESGKVSVAVDSRGLVVSLREAAFYASGGDGVSSASLPILDKIAPVLLGLANPVRLEGHTDSIPIHNSRFRNNWELSTARSIAMLELLRDRYQFPVERLSVSGFAENAPVDTNETEEGRAHNRRVDLVVLSAEALTGEPPAAITKKE